MVAGDRRRLAASNAAETVMGSPPNRTADRARCSIGPRALVARVRPPARPTPCGSRQLLRQAPRHRPRASVCSDGSNAPAAEAAARVARIVEPAQLAFAIAPHDGRWRRFAPVIWPG